MLLQQKKKKKFLYSHWLIDVSVYERLSIINFTFMIYLLKIGRIVWDHIWWVRRNSSNNKIKYRKKITANENRKKKCTKVKNSIEINASSYLYELRMKIAIQVIEMSFRRAKKKNKTNLVRMFFFIHFHALDRPHKNLNTANKLYSNVIKCLYSDRHTIRETSKW